MITEKDILPLLEKACPSLVPDRDILSAPYVFFGYYSRHLLMLYKQGDTECFDDVAKTIEDLHTLGDSYVKEAATVGLLEDIQNIWSDSGVDPEEFYKYLYPESKLWWNSLKKFWNKQIPYVGADI